MTREEVVSSDKVLRDRLSKILDDLTAVNTEITKLRVTCTHPETSEVMICGEPWDVCVDCSHLCRILGVIGNSYV